MYPYDNNNDDFFDFLDDSPNQRSLQRGGQPGFFPGGGPGGRFPQQPPFGGGGPGVFPQQPPFGGGGPGVFPQQPPFGGGPQTGRPPGGQLTPPSAPPPSFTPQITTLQGTAEFSRRGGGRGIGRCLFRNTFIWMTNGNSFWFYPMFAFGNSIVGFRWRGNRGWVYDVLNRNRIAFFQCY